MGIISVRWSRGASLVDLMVGLAIGMAAMLVTLTVAVSFDARRRSVIGVAEAQGNAAYAVALISRELRLAGSGLGLSAAHGCTVHRAASGNASDRFVLRPTVITAGKDGAADALITLASGTRAVPPARLIAPYTVGMGLLQLDSTLDMATGDYLLLQSDGQPDCVLLKIAGFGAGSSYAVQPSVAPGLLPDTVFGIGSAAINLGHLRYRRYSVDAQQRLLMESFSPAAGLWVGSTLADGITSLRLQYGFDARAGAQLQPQVTRWAAAPIDADGNGSIDAADWRRLLAVRIAIVSRSAQRKEGACDTAAPQWLAGNDTSGQLELTSIRVDHLPEWRCWRYRVLQTEVALRNLIWSDD